MDFIRRFLGQRLFLVGLHRSRPAQQAFADLLQLLRLYFGVLRVVQLAERLDGLQHLGHHRLRRRGRADLIRSLNLHHHLLLAGIRGNNLREIVQGV